MQQKTPPILDYSRPRPQRNRWLFAAFAGGWLAGVALSVAGMIALLGGGGSLIWQLAVYGMVAGLPVFGIVLHRAKSRTSDVGSAFATGLLSAPPIMIIFLIIAILNFHG